MMSKIIYFVLFLLFSGRTIAQHTVAGKVIDEDTREPLEMTLVHDLGTGRTVFTDRHGYFTPLAVSGDSLWIEVSYIGYRSRQVKIKAGEINALIRMEKSVLDMKAVTINAQTDLNAFHTLSRIDLNMQPARSAQDLLRLVPGLFIAQHQGGGKAEQIFLRGFDADHGTDVSISVDGLPVNLVSHAHGQGYADLHFLIPETVAGYDFGKGPYYAPHGDFTTAGYVAYHTIDVLNRNMIKLEGGQYHTARLVTLLNLLNEGVREKGQSAYIAGEALYSDGPFDEPEHFKRFNIFGKWIRPAGQNQRLTLSLSLLSSQWRASGEIPNRAVREGYIPDRFGVIDSAQGGTTSRFNANLSLLSTLSHHLTLEQQVYFSSYFFNLISNFTFYYFYPQTGDEFRQHESRDLTGYQNRLNHQVSLGPGMLTSSVGLGIRSDLISPAYLAHTQDAMNILNFIELGRIRETNANAYIDESLQTGPWLFETALRFDKLDFAYLNEAPPSDSLSAIYGGRSPKSSKNIFCPKINIQYTAGPQWQFYVKAGKGFHSNDARIVIANQGYQVLPAAFGMDLGLNWKPSPDLFINTALWMLYLQQEFTYGADLGDQAVSPGGRTQREGIDLSVRYQLCAWLYSFLNVDLARPRELGVSKGMNDLPLAPTFTSTGGLDLKFSNGISGSIAYRYLHNRAANEDYSLTALGYWVTDMTVGYTRKKYALGLTIENLFNIGWNESQFAYTSRLKYESQAVDEVSYTPGTPIFAKLKCSFFF